VAALLGVERQRAVLGCDDRTCASELAGALGTELAVLGDVSRIGDTIRVTTKLSSTHNGQRVAGYAETVGSADAVPRALSRSGWRLGSLILARHGAVPSGLPPAAVVSGEPPPGRRLVWLPAALGSVALVGGVIMEAKALDDLAQLNPRVPISLAEAQHYRDEGKLLQPLGLASITLGAAAIASAVAMYYVGGGPPQGVQLSVLATPQGAFAAWSANWP
jgi:hypothetical protein